MRRGGGGRGRDQAAGALPSEHEVRGSSFCWQRGGNTHDGPHEQLVGILRIVGAGVHCARPPAGNTGGKRGRDAGAKRVLRGANSNRRYFRHSARVRLTLVPPRHCCRRRPRARRP